VKILFVCSRNKRRSRTAEKIFKNHKLFYAKSAGFSEKSPVKINVKLILWADLILLMEYEHSKRLIELFSEIKLPEIGILNIKDKYEYMDEKLIALLTEKVKTYTEKTST
jgi:protein-tyrosine phosphatase